ncbi:MAG: thiamine diphosphokinase [Acidobacteriota bacterium]
MVEQHPAILVLNGDLEWTEDLARLAREAPLLLAADGGANALGRLGVRPDTVVGDLDSIEADTRNWIGEEQMLHRPDQHKTDFEKALEFAFEQSSVDRLTVLGALGGRLDHTVGNLGVLAREARGPALVLVTEKEWVLATASPVDLEANPGETWSFWTFDPEVRITLEGVRWPVDNVPLTLGGRPSISNEATGTHVRVVPTGGPVVVWRLLN